LFAELVDRSNEKFYGHHLRALPDYNICSIRFSVNAYAFLFALLLPPPGIYETRKKSGTEARRKRSETRDGNLLKLQQGFSYSASSIVEN
jgi:hypothetical protein